MTERHDMSERLISERIESLKEAPLVVIENTAERRFEVRV